MRGEMEFEGKPKRFADWLMEPMRANRPVYMRVALAAFFIKFLNNIVHAVPSP